MLNWKLLRGSHEFPGPDGGTCVNEAAIVAAGYPYTLGAVVSTTARRRSRVRWHFRHVPERIALDDELRQDLLLPFVTRLAGSADAPESTVSVCSHI